MTARSEVPYQLRRRRAAAYRCPALNDGRQDPADPPKRRAVVQVRAIGRNTIEFTGCDRAVYLAITTLCARYQRAPKGGAWLVQQQAVEDVIALLETRGYRIEAIL